MKRPGYMKSRSKYHAKKTMMDGILFDSKKEANRWFELRMLEREGEISDLQRQVEYELIPAQYETYERYSEKTGKRLKDGRRCVEKKCSYFADFVYTDKDGNKIVEDTKGMRTPDYIIKRKLMLNKYGIRIKEV